ncbi:MAG TPA: HAD-IC family P-type ATPase, partial [Burkholderiaceae bacterium]|nr:HAD-IC family P-type ATPase [Burkholderiaceae bacterium]
METSAAKLTLLRELYAGFVRARGISRHFRRFTLFESLLRDTASREALPPLADALLKASRASPEEVLASLGSHPNGLTESQAAEIRMRVGMNEVGHEKPLPWHMHLWRCYRNPFNLLLTVLAAISYWTEDVRATIVIGSMVMLSTLIRFVQETRSNKAADRLKEMVSTTSTVLRRDPAEIAAEEARRYFQAVLRPKPPRRMEIALKRLVPGDVVMLSAGDMIPADVRLLSAKDLFVGQSAMTGESLPVEKFAEHRGAPTNNPMELDNIAFMGTNVVSGSALGIVVTTANQTYFGALAQKVTAAAPTTNAFQAGVNKVSWLLIRFMIVMTPLVLVINGFTKGNTLLAWKDAFLFALSIAVGLTPEMLPMIVTSTLAKGAVYLSRKKVIVKRLDAIQNFGAMDVLCTDKTGTLTQDKIFLSRTCGAFGEDFDTVLEYAYLNSYYQTGLKNLLDVA